MKKKLFAAIIALMLVVPAFLQGCAGVPPLKSAPPGTAVTTDAPQSTDMLYETAEPSAAEDLQVSYISVDINPSIELALSGGLVQEARGYNDDGAAIILALDLVGMTPQDAVSALVGSFATEGFITPQSTDTAIVITVAGAQDEGLADSLKQNAQQSLSALGLSGQVLATAVAEEIVQTAGNCDLSIGRYLLLKQIALQESISLGEARDKYGATRMGELLAMIENIDSFMGDVQQLSSILDSLTPEQTQILNQARTAFEASMKTAQQTFLAVRKEAKNAFMTARDAAKDAFLSTKDNGALKAAKQQIKDAFALGKKTATENMKQAKVQARTDFMAAVASLGLDDEVIERLLEWDFDMDFDFDMDMDFGDEDGGEADAQYKDDDEVQQYSSAAGDSTGNAKDKDVKKSDNGQGKGENGKGNSRRSS